MAPVTTSEPTSFAYSLRMDSAFALQFASDWRDAWNAHDLDAIVSHFADQIVFTSPVAQRLVDGSDGVIRGRDERLRYWSEGLRRNPDLHFEIEDLYLGVDTLVINYRNHSGGLVNEVLTFEGPLVIQGHATYLDA
jgi:ketosteroid isomerase-like protein